MIIEYNISLYFLAVVAGALAGFVNTLAGSGSLITLPLLIFFGLPPSMANATNRIGIIFQNITGVLKYKQKGKLNLKGARLIFVASILGAIVGAFVAVDISERAMRYTIAATLGIMLVPVLFRPKEWLRQHTEEDKGLSTPLKAVVFFLIGVYGGFIQAGVGILLLAGMVMGSGFSLVRANGVKLAVTLAFSLPAALIFIINDQVVWKIGIVMAIGQSVGGWAAANYAAESEKAALWIRRLLIAIIIISIVKLLVPPDFISRL